LAIGSLEDWTKRDQSHHTEGLAMSRILNDDQLYARSFALFCSRQEQ